MYRQKIGVSVSNGYKIPTAELVPILKKIGFDAISPSWEGADLGAIVRAAREVDITLESLHAPYHSSDDIWSPNATVGDAFLEKLLASLADAKRYAISTLVVHACELPDENFPVTEEGLCRFDALVEKAEAYGIRIALENTGGAHLLSALMARYRDKAVVGFCFDSGHEMCYSHGEDLLALYGDRLLVTHLNDNLGVGAFDGEISWCDDLHLLPYDGVLDWNDIVTRLRRARPLACINLEVGINSRPARHENDKYMRLSLEEYFTEAYNRACRVAYRYAK
ncbi:MAG: sugar phosphate isomerase/epimerase [Clostridia bacterium]|nr:sugar phosphate isomerase/epimerase [Clostridia bacterium]